ncbi:hypothetical protein E6R60_26370 [Streptomyces sp. A0642]|uniref:hypothetical protein n=1 Tax=Streptomyces sp. A0642 TaxID=2563100 RepID=UPI0010A24865|nr:hypothetical protein [Streptomyces sp. A0642]THA72459.1 hypothetical protein E6R60_26370 [Streptomyces sp. A0642]
MTAFVPNFTRIAAQTQTLRLVPLIENAVQACAFPDPFTVTFRAYSANRKPDGWFHPSSHPTMDERKLYYYLADPDRWVDSTFEYGPRMSVLMGSASHDLIQHVMTKMGLLLAPKGICVCCARPHGHGIGQCNEWGVRDDTLKRRGHIDGFIDLPDFDGIEVWDLKTCAPPVIRNIEHNDLEAFKKKWPKYYGQAQEYMALTGKLQAVILFLAMSEGWVMREFTIPRDDAYIARTEAKYRTVLRYVDLGTPPPVACCSGGARARDCAAASCPVKIGLAA